MLVQLKGMLLLHTDTFSDPTHSKFLGTEGEGIMVAEQPARGQQAAKLVYSRRKTGQCFE